MMATSIKANAVDGECRFVSQIINVSVY